MPVDLHQDDKYPGGATTLHDLELAGHVPQHSCWLLNLPPCRACNFQCDHSPRAVRLHSDRHLSSWMDYSLIRTNRGFEPIELNGRLYHRKLLSEEMQGARSSTYDILEGFLLDNGSRAPAILKVMSYKGHDSKAYIKKEIKYLTKVSTPSYHY